MTTVDAIQIPASAAANAATAATSLRRLSVKKAMLSLVLVALLPAAAQASVFNVMFKNTVAGEILTFVDGQQLENGYCPSPNADRSVSCYVNAPGHTNAPTAGTLDDKQSYHGTSFTYWIGEQGGSGDTQAVSDYLTITQLLADSGGTYYGSGTSLFVEFWSDGEGTGSGKLCKDQINTGIQGNPSGCVVTENGTKQSILDGIQVYYDTYNFSFSSGTPPGVEGDATVPEPDSIALVLSALGAMDLARRQRRRRTG